LAIEAGELQETMLWKTDSDVDQLLKTPDGRKSISSEIADILIYGFLLCDATGTDPAAARARDGAEQVTPIRAQGKSSPEIAQELGRGVGTVCRAYRVALRSTT
jgi:MazG-like family